MRAVAKLGIYMPQYDYPVIQKLLGNNYGNLANQALIAATLLVAVRFSLYTYD